MTEQTVARGAGAPLAAFAALLADRTRATFCLAMLDGRAWTAGELARRAGVAASTATEQINQLVAGGLLVDQRAGRHRYVRLADARAAQMIEDLAAFADPLSADPLSADPSNAHPSHAAGAAAARPSGGSTLRTSSIAAALRHARTCYDHLAGHVGVVLIDAMADRGLLDQINGVALTPGGLTWLGDLGIDVDGLRRVRRPIVRHCLDWTERRPHLAGSAGAAICQRMFAMGWIERIGSDRAVRVTAAGRRGLGDVLDLAESALVPQSGGLGGGGR